MKKFTLLLASIFFLAFLLVGYKLAARVFPPRQAIQPTVILNTFDPQTQSNYLLLHVNDFSDKNPQLISIWVYLRSISAKDEVFFVSLYPTINLESNSQIESLFSLNREHRLTTSSIRRINRIFDLAIDGYFVVDNTGLLSLASDAGVEKLEIITSSPSSLESAQIVNKNGKIFLSTICDFLNSGAGDSFFSQINLESLIPAHMTSNKTLEEVVALFESTKLPSNSSSCNVIVPE